MIRRVANVDPTLRPFQWTQSEIARHAEIENGDLRTLSCSARIESPRICRSTVDPKFSALFFFYDTSCKESQGLALSSFSFLSITNFRILVDIGE